MPGIPSPHTLGPHIVARIEQYILDHLAEVIRLADLARVAHMGRCYFGTVWSLRTGETPTQTMRRLRMNEACRLLHQGLKLRYVANQVGYARGAGWFGRAFKAEVGMTPMEYARMGRG